MCGEVKIFLFQFGCIFFLTFQILFLRIGVGGGDKIKMTKKEVDKDGGEGQICSRKKNKKTQTK